MSKMNFNAKKCSIIAFKPQKAIPSYTLDGTILEHTDHTKYLGVTLQSDLRFDYHIANKIGTARQQIGMIRRALYWAPENAKLTAYKALCRPHLEYAAAAWDPSAAKDIDAIELVQNLAVRLITGIKGREGVSEAKEKLQLAPLQQRRKNARFSLLMKILAADESHPALNTAYEELTSQPKSTVETRAQARGVPRSVGASGNLYFNSFLPRTIRDMKINVTNNIEDTS